MPPDRAELSSIVSTLADLAGRIAAMTEQAITDRDDLLANELTAVERSLITAHRRLDRAVVR